MILNPSKYLSILQYFSSVLLLGDIIKAVAKMDRSHVICILDICSLGNNKAEVYLHKIYKPNKTS